MPRVSRFKKVGEHLVEAFEEGAISVAAARRVARVTAHEWKAWRRKGMAGEPDYVEWWDRIERARGKMIVVAEDCIYQAVKSGSTAEAKWFLKIHGPAIYRGENEEDEDNSRMQVYVPGSSDEQVEALKTVIRRVMAVADGFPDEWRVQLIAALNG